MTDKIEQNRLLELQEAREADDITTFEYCRGVYLSVAEIIDRQAEQNEQAPNGPSNTDIVEQLFEGEDFNKLYWNAVHNSVNPRAFMVVPSAISPNKRDESDRFMKPVLQDDVYYGGGPNFYEGDTRRKSSSEFIAQLLTEHNPYPQEGDDRLHPLDLYTAAFLDLGAYRYIDKSARELIENKNSMRPAPGYEEKFWVSRILGSNQRAGIATALGFAHKMDGRVKEISSKLYDPEARRYADAFMAMCITGHRPNEVSNSDLLTPIARPLMDGDIAEAEYQIKSLLYQHPGVLPFPTRRTYELTDEEIEYFDAIYNIEDEVEETLRVDRSKPVEQQPMSYAESLQQLEYAQELVGKFIAIDKEDDGNIRYFYVRDIKAYEPRKYADAVPRDKFSPIAWTVDALNYDEVNGGFVRRRDNSVSSLFGIAAIWEAQNRTAVLDVYSEIDAKVNAPSFVADSEITVSS